MSLSIASALHTQLADMLRNRIASGDAPAGSLLPTEQQLTTSYAVSRTVVRQAMQALEFEGLVTRVAGKGTFVRERADAPVPGWSVGSIEELLAYGLNTRLKVLSRREVRAPEFVARALDIATGSTVFQIRGLRSSGEELFSYQSNYFLRDIGRTLARADLSKGSLLAVLQSRVSLTLTHAEQVVTALPASAEIADLLGVERNAPILQIERVFVSAERGPVEVGVMSYRPDRYRYRSRLTHATEEAPAMRDRRARSTLGGRRRLTLIRGEEIARSQPGRHQDDLPVPAGASSGHRRRREI